MGGGKGQNRCELLRTLDIPILMVLDLSWSGIRFPIVRLPIIDPELDLYDNYDAL